MELWRLSLNFEGYSWSHGGYQWSNKCSPLSLLWHYWAMEAQPVPWRRNLSHEEYSWSIKNHLGDVEALNGALEAYPGVKEACFKAKFSSCWGLPEEEKHIQYCSFGGAPCTWSNQCTDTGVRRLPKSCGDTLVHHGAMETIPGFFLVLWWVSLESSDTSSGSEGKC